MEEEGVFLPVLHTTEDENHDDDEIEACCSEYPPPPPGYYSDTVVAPTTITSSSPRTSSFDDEPWSEEATLPSTVAFPNNYDHHDGSIVTSELISIAPENVQVVAEQEDEEDEEDDFVKNTQHVMIT